MFSCHVQWDLYIYAMMHLDWGQNNIYSTGAQCSRKSELTNFILLHSLLMLSCFGWHYVKFSCSLVTNCFSLGHISHMPHKKTIIYDMIFGLGGKAQDCDTGDLGLGLIPGFATDFLWTWASISVFSAEGLCFTTYLYNA